MEASDRESANGSANKSTTGSTSEELEQVIADIQTNGGNILVTGAVPQHATATVSQHLFGTTDISRKRILAVTNSSIECPNAFLPDGVTTDDSDVWLIDQREAPRSLSATAAVPETDRPSLESNECDDLDALRRDITDAISVFSKTTDLDTRELRLSVNSLAVPLGSHGLDAVEHFLTQILPLVAAHDGMGHYFLPIDPDDVRVETLRPLFDAHVEIRKRNGHPTEQRWHLPGHDQPTRWLTFTTCR